MVIEETKRNSVSFNVLLKVINIIVENATNRFFFRKRYHA